LHRAVLYQRNLLFGKAAVRTALRRAAHQSSAHRSGAAAQPQPGSPPRLTASSVPPVKKQGAAFQEQAGISHWVYNKVTNVIVQVLLDINGFKPLPKCDGSSQKVQGPIRAKTRDLHQLSTEQGQLGF